MRYIVKAGGKISGPFTSKQLREMAGSGQLSPDDQIRKESDSQWYVANKLKGLFSSEESERDADVVAFKPKKSRASKARGASKRPAKNPLVIGAILLMGVASAGAAIWFFGSKPNRAEQKSSDPVEQQPIATAERANEPALSKSGTDEAERANSTLARFTPGRTPQQEWADKLKLPVEYTNSMGTQFVLVPPGEFQMGSDEPESHAREKPIHTVRITRPFYIGKYPVTVSEFSQFIDATRYVTTGETLKNGYAGWGVGDGSMARVNDISWKKPGFEQTNRDPVVMVSPLDVKAYCDHASKVTGKRLRLPTEAEWEYAARGPENLRYPWGNLWNGALSNHADRTLRTAGFAFRHTDGCPELRYPGYEQNKSDTETDGYVYTSPVGILKNASWCGVFDMSGNVWQWLTDLNDDKYYASSATDDPRGADNGLTIRRGGSFLNDSINCRSTQRFFGGNDERDAATGFRLLMEVDQVSIATKKGPEDKAVPATPTSTPKDDKLAFRDDGRGNFLFNTGVVQGSVQKEGTSDTLRHVSYVDPDFRINNDHHGLLIPYRFLTPQKRYGVGSWEWPHAGQLQIDGSIKLNWEQTSDRPFSFSTEYRWKAADTVDMTLVFTPDTDLQNFELFVGSYFNKFSKGAVYTQDSGSGKLGFTETPADKGVVQLFPRNETVLGLVRDGRWTFPPFPNDWAIRTALQAPLAMGKDNNIGVTVLLMSPPEDCFAVSTATLPDQGLMAIYLSLFGKDVKKNQSLTGRARLVFGKNISDEKAIEDYQKYLSELAK